MPASVRLLESLAANRRAFFKLIDALEEVTNSHVDPMELETILDSSYSEESDKMEPADAHTILMEVSRRKGKRV